MSWIDMHAHLDKLPEGADAALKLAYDAGVTQVVTIGTEPADHAVVLALSQKYFPQVFCTLGVHPHEAGLYTDEVETWIRENAADRGVVAVGEIGLDYYYDHADRNVQRNSFERQLELAKSLKLPVEIHTRDAEEDTVEILKKFKGEVKGIIHCFTGSEKLAFDCLDLGLNISISGVVTFKNAESLRSTVKKLPLDRIHVETDAPFLAPIPMRGKPNTPAFMIHTANFVRSLKDVDAEKFMEQMTLNARQMFPKIISS